MPTGSSISALQDLKVEMEGIAKLEQVIPATKKLAVRICKIVDAYARDKGCTVKNIAFDDAVWQADGHIMIRIQKLDAYDLHAYAAPHKAWHEMSSLTEMDKAGFGQVVSFMFALGSQLLPICKVSGTIRPTRITFDKPTCRERDGEKEIILRAYFEDSKGALEGIKDRGTV